MVKPEHRHEFNRLEAEKARRRRSKFWRFIDTPGMKLKIFLSMLSAIGLILLVFLMSFFLAHRDTSKVVTNNEIVLAKTDFQKSILVNLKDKEVVRNIKYYGLIRSPFKDLMAEILNPGDVAIDIGSGFGYYTALMSEIVGKKGFVYSFEAVPEVFSLMEKTVRMNGMSNVLPSTTLLYSKHSNVLLVRSEENMEYSRIILSKPSNDFYKNSTLVEASTLDQELKNISKVRLIRINTFGSELEVLLGANEIINHSPNISIFMYWDVGLMSEYSNVPNVVNDLQDLGFEFWGVNGAQRKFLTKDALLKYYGYVLITRENIN